VSYEQGDWYLIKYDGKFGYVQKQYIAKTKVSEISNPDPVVDDIHKVKWTGVVNTKNGTLNVRTQPSISAKKCSFSPLRKGVEVGVCHQNGNWYLIKYGGKYGYVYSSYIKKR
jgi:probable enterotoxin D